MSKQVGKNNSPEAVRNILKHANDEMHRQISPPNNNTVVVATHNRDDPRKFTIVADSEYDRQLEGVELVFSNLEDYKRVFPELSAPPPVMLAPNMEMDRKRGVAVPIHKDPYKIHSIVASPQPKNPQANAITNVLNSNDGEYWSVKMAAAERPPMVIMDLGRDSEIGTVWVKWHMAKERRTKFTVAVATEEQYDSSSRVFTVIDRLNGKYSSGTTEDFEPYNLSDDPDMLVVGRYLMLKITGNNADSEWASIRQVKVTRAVSVKSLETELSMANNNGGNSSSSNTDNNSKQ
jgi:hypothetical protein